MKDETKIEVDHAALRFMGAALRMAGSMEKFSAAGAKLGKAAVGLGSEIARPCVPVLHAGASIVEGCADIYLWTADRIAAVASHLEIASGGVKIVHDREGDATLEEIGEALKEAERVLNPAANIAVRYTGDGKIESYVPSTETRWSASGFGDPADGARRALGILQAGEDFAIERFPGSWQRAELVVPETVGEYTAPASGTKPGAGMVN